jgi:hypothetical protein
LTELKNEVITVLQWLSQEYHSSSVYKEFTSVALQLFF